MYVPLSEQIAAVKREIAMRDRVYPKWVEAGKISAQTASREMLAMRAVLETLLGAERLERECGVAVVNGR